MRVINIDDDTCIGYDFENKNFFVTNKGTTTTRTAIPHILDVLNIVAPDHTVTENDLISLSTTLESLTDLYYTWSDTGSYIKTIQLNTYDKYPLAIDAEKSKLYIMNSTIIYDLTLSEAQRTRLEHIQAFYRDTIGLLATLSELRTLYNTLIHFYNPACYNTITTIEDTTDNYSLYYTNTLQLSNFRNTSRATYTCTLNPNKQYNYNTIGEISRIEENAITLTTAVPSQVQPKTTINITNTATTIPPTTYTADGTYEVQAVEGNTIYTTEILPANFSVTLPTLNIQAYQNYITEIDRDQQSITLTNFATDFLIGDTIVVRGVSITTEYETLSLDGFYSIIGIEDNVIYVDEVPLTNYTAPIGAEPTAYVYKPIPVLTVTAINDRTITVAEDTFPSTLTIGTEVVIFTQEEEDTATQYGTLTGIDETNKKLVVDTELTDNVQRYGLLREPTPYPNTLVNVTSSSKEDVLPIGTFMLDTQEQAISYLGLLNDLILPSNEELEADINNIGNFNSCGTQVRDYYMIDLPNIQRMTCKGLYSKVYSEKVE